LQIHVEFPSIITEALKLWLHESTRIVVGAKSLPINVISDIRNVIPVFHSLLCKRHVNVSLEKVVVTEAIKGDLRK
jgi:hypothetical protein